MPVLTPSIEGVSTNAALSVSSSSLTVIESELNRGYKIMKKIKKGKAEIEDLMAEFDTSKHY